eukprot:SAG31_NODE_17474_length_669_cov_0.964912_1_plen_88_part_10
MFYAIILPFCCNFEQDGSPMDWWASTVNTVGRFSNLFFGIDYFWTMLAPRDSEPGTRQCLHNFLSDTKVIDLAAPLVKTPLATKQVTA